jgi:hypothetical protein
MINPLSEVSGYSELLSYYNQEKTKKWDEWLSYDTTFEKAGKQGLVGLLKIKSDKISKRIVFKLSQHINYLIRHESVIMRGLNALSAYCPHFCKYIGNIECEVDPRARKEGNPFNISEVSHPIKKEVLLCEHVDKSHKLHNLIRASEKDLPEKVLYSTIKQVLLAITLAQKKKRFTHYDLHSFNVMMKRCNKDVVFLYVLDDETQYCVPSNGHYPVIIDFGFSYIDDMEDGPLWTTMAHTNAGFMSDRFDWMADPKLFLSTVSGEIKDKRKTQKAKTLRRLVKNMFTPLKINWDTGWDNFDDISAVEQVTDIIHESSNVSVLFRDYEVYCMDIIQSLIVLPMEAQDTSMLSQSYELFLKEWVKIENHSTSVFYNLCIFKDLVDAARYVRAAYMDPTTRIEATRVFTNMLHSSINKVAKFCNPKGIDYEKMLCSLLIFSRNMEGILHSAISERMADKKQQYEKLHVQSTEQIYTVIEVNIPDEYIFNPNTTILVMDSTQNSTDIMDLTDKETEEINNILPIYRGTALYDFHKQKKTFS